jgi:hypothetical protein
MAGKPVIALRGDRTKRGFGGILFRGRATKVTPEGGVVVFVFVLESIVFIANIRRVFEAGKVVFHPLAVGSDLLAALPNRAEIRMLRGCVGK